MPNQGAYPRLLNLRSYVVDRLETRPGETLVTAAPLDQLNVHSIRRLNDAVPGAALAWTRVVGSGTKLYTGQAAIAIRDTGYSGNPLALVPYRPDFSPEPLMYVGDSSKMSKVTVGGTVSNMGIAPPLNPPVTELGQPLFKTVEVFDSNPGALWAAAAPAGAISVVARANTTISQILYDTGSTGWACVVPTAYPFGLQFHSLVYADQGGASSELLEVEQVCPPISTTTIAAIQYDSGATGACCIVLTASSAIITGLMRNSVVGLNIGGGNAQYVRVVSATQGNGNQWSFRCSTTATHVAGEAVTGYASFRAYTTNTHAAAQTLTVNCFQTTVTAPTGPNYFPGVIGTSVDNIDLSTIGGRPTQPDDEFHISLAFDKPQNVVQINLIMDVDATLATQDFDHNYYQYYIRQNDLAASTALSGIPTTSAQQTGIQQQVISQFVTTLGESVPISQTLASPYNPNAGVIANPLGTPTGQTATGNLQFSEVVFKVSDVLSNRVGTDFTRTLANVDRLRITINVLDSTVCQFGAWTLTGAYGVKTLSSGVDIGDTGGDVFYRYRGRSSTTGAKSNPSPATRYGLKPHRVGVNVTMTQHPDAQVDKLDIFRFGGDITSAWPYVGTTDNSATPTFFDVNDDTTVSQSGVTLEFDNFQPFPTVDIARSGTCNVVGTSVRWASGSTFNTSWAEGSEITIGGIPYTLYRQPQSTTVLEIVENAGAQTGATFFLNEPTILAQPLPALWGPFYGQFFAVGDLYQPGYVFRTKGNNPDSAPDTYQDEVTSPSEPMMNGCLYAGGSFAWSSNRKFAVIPSQNADGSIAFSYQEVPGPGLFTRWGFCVGDVIYYIETGGVGIRATAGGDAGVSLTDQDLSLLFPHDGQAGVVVTLGTVTFQPPDMTKLLRLSYEDRHLYFDYTDLNGDKQTMVYSTVLGVWSLDSYNVPAIVHYEEEGAGLHSVLIGGNDGNVYQLAGSTDNGVAITGNIRMPYVGDAFPSFSTSRDGYIGLTSSGTLNLVLNADGADNLVALASTAGVYGKVYVVAPALKAKAWEFGLQGNAPWTLYQRDCLLRLGAWGGDYQPLNPFANLRRLTT